MEDLWLALYWGSPIGTGIFLVCLGGMLYLLSIFAYSIFMEAYVGWTAGKKILEMRVVDGTGNKIGLSKSVVRNLHVNKFNRLLHCQGKQKSDWATVKLA